ncbi:MFS transporter [Mycobacterium sp. 1274756.6]|uniref:CynX/NimT family MFS transporter n=1 Tax=Mycobacterium sp. 1274756.6 TaxID=1834076 RepID=UPI0007FD8A12|nr:MFS transporter [Mycobacterium sp. 1274756.6]OBJ70588.1 MFS transporter [Mycobacterium sp. 1274756.6]
MRSPVDRLRAYRGGGALLVAAVVLVALNLRPAITSVGPVLGEIRRTFGQSAAWAGVLTTLPVLCFAAAGLAAPWLSRRIGLARAISWALSILAAGLLLRVLAGSATMLGGTLIATAGIALVNVLIPVVVKGAFPTRIGLMTGLYTAALQGGGALGFALTPPLTVALGGWRPALASWAVLAGGALLVWLVAARGHNRLWSPAGTPALQRGASLLRNRLAWTVTVFFGTQAFLAYVVMGWLPEVFIERGVSKSQAGLLLGLVSLIAVPISLFLSPLAARRDSQAGWILALGLPGLAGVLGLLLAPGAAPLLWSVLIGLGMSVFSLALTVIALRTRTAEQTARLSGMAQGLGYLLAAAGPLLFGLLREYTGGWTAPWLVVTVVYVVQLVAGTLAGRHRYV